MAVPLADPLLAVDATHYAVGFQHAFLAAQPHRATQVGLGIAPLDLAVTVLPLGDQRNDRVRRVRVEFGAVRTHETGYVARVLNDGELHAETDTEIRHLVFPCIANRPNLSFDPALSESAGNEDRIHRGECAGAILL